MNEFRIIKEIIKKGKKISIICNNFGVQFLKKQVINLNNEDLLLSLKNEIMCLEILRFCNISPKLIEYNLDDKMPYLMTEYIDYDRLDYFQFSGLEEKLICMINILNAVNIIHSKGIIHCDLKPQNIFINKEFDIKIIDFGISSIDGKRELINYGSLNYCSPEQINMEKVTVQTDIFSLGIILYKLLTEKIPFERTKDTLKRKIEYEKIEKINNTDLNFVFLKAINEDLNYRYKNVIEFREDLIKILNNKEGLYE